MAEMVYVKVVLGVNMDWPTIPLNPKHNKNQTYIIEFRG
jgi:hypothetical protein